MKKEEVTKKLAAIMLLVNEVHKIQSDIKEVLETLGSPHNEVYVEEVERLDVKIRELNQKQSNMNTYSNFLLDTHQQGSIGLKKTIFTAHNAVTLAAKEGITNTAKTFNKLLSLHGANKSDFREIEKEIIELHKEIFSKQTKIIISGLDEVRKLNKDSGSKVRK
jgi:uncharacterized protein YlaN (UPF0358 family)